MGNGDRLRTAYRGADCRLGDRRSLPAVYPTRDLVLPGLDTCRQLRTRSLPLPSTAAGRGHHATRISSRFLAAVIRPATPDNAEASIRSRFGFSRCIPRHSCLPLHFRGLPGYITYLLKAEQKLKTFSDLSPALTDDCQRNCNQFDRDWSTLLTIGIATGGMGVVTLWRLWHNDPKEIFQSSRGCSTVADSLPFNLAGAAARQPGWGWRDSPGLRIFGARSWGYHVFG